MKLIFAFCNLWIMTENDVHFVNFLILKNIMKFGHFWWLNPCTDFEETKGLFDQCDVHIKYFMASMIDKKYNANSKDLWPHCATPHLHALLHCAEPSGCTLIIWWIVFENCEKMWVLITLAPASKGQLISKCPFGVKTSSKKPTKFFSRISALASKKRSNKKNEGTLYH